MVRALFFASLLLITQILPSVPLSYASDVDLAGAGKRKINLSGRQRMLSQRMAKAVCFAAIGVMTDKHVKMASGAHDLFARTLKGLRIGDSEQGLTAETAPRILKSLKEVEELWIHYSSAVSTALGGQESAKSTLPAVDSLNGPTLTQMNAAVGEFQSFYGAGGSIHPSLALALNISGRQRMLSQKASKEFCMVLSGTRSAEHRAALAKTVALFENSLTALMDGNDTMGLPPAPTAEIQEQLKLVQDLWKPLKLIFLKVANGEEPSSVEIETIAQDNNELLVEMNKAVWMYDDL